MKPTMGRIVFFQLDSAGDLGVRAAVVTKVNRNGSVDLHVFLQHDDDDVEEADFLGVVQDESTEHTLHTWHWPPRVA